MLTFRLLVCNKETAMSALSADCWVTWREHVSNSKLLFHPLPLGIWAFWAHCLVTTCPLFDSESPAFITGVHLVSCYGHWWPSCGGIQRTLCPHLSWSLSNMCMFEISLKYTLLLASMTHTAYLFSSVFLPGSSWVVPAPQLRSVPWCFSLPSIFSGWSLLIPPLYNPMYQLAIAAILLCNRLPWNSVSDRSWHFLSEESEAQWEKWTSRGHEWHVF